MHAPGDISGGLDTALLRLLTGRDECSQWSSVNKNDGHLIEGKRSTRRLPRMCCPRDPMKRRVHDPGRFAGEWLGARRQDPVE